MTTAIERATGTDGILRRMFAAMDRPIRAIWFPWLVLGAMLTLLALPLGWTGDEEQYLPLALRAAAPERFGPWSAVFDSGRERVVGFWLIGSVIRVVGYQIAHLLTLAASTALLSAGVVRLARWLRLSLLDTIVAVAVFWMCRETLFGGEWMLGAAEPKTLAHGCGLLGFAAAAERRWRRGAGWLAAGLYLHFLAAGFWLAAATALLLFVKDRRTATALLSGTLVLCLPLFVLLVEGQLAARSVVRPPGLPPADFIYSVLRVPHHVAPFAAIGGWRFVALTGLWQAALIGIGAAALAWRAPPRRRAIGLLVGAIAVYLWVAMALSWLDRHDGALGKFYLFRPASPFLLLTIVAGLAYWRPLTIDRPVVRLIPATALLALFVPLALGRWHSKQEPGLAPPARELVAALQAHVAADAPVLLDPATDAMPQLARLSGRQTVVEWKFLPSYPADTYRWWSLLQRRRLAFAGDCAAIPAAVAYIVATRASATTMQRCGDTVWANPSFVLYRKR